MSRWSPAIVPLSVFPQPKGFAMPFLAFPSFPKTQAFTPCPSVCLQRSSCAFLPSSVPFFSCATFKSGVLSCCPPKGVVLLPPAACSLAPHLSSPLVSQFQRIVFCWINKLDRLSEWFDVVQERAWTSRARSQGGKSRTTQVRTVS